MPVAPYRIMWLFVMFDLPVDTKEDRKTYTRFRNDLLRLGFTMLQFSVYAKHMPSEDAADHLRIQLRHAVPERGHLRLMAVTDRQFGKMDVISGGKAKPVEDPPMQISLF
jgi:CRISPR-associated protein Cas2